MDPLVLLHGQVVVGVLSHTVAVLSWCVQQQLGDWTINGGNSGCMHGRGITYRHISERCCPIWRGSLPNVRVTQGSSYLLLLQAHQQQESQQRCRRSISSGRPHCIYAKSYLERACFQFAISMLHY